MTDFGGSSGTGRGHPAFRELKKITDTKAQPIKEYVDGYGSLTDEQADSLIWRRLDSEIGNVAKEWNTLAVCFRSNQDNNGSRGHLVYRLLQRQTWLCEIVGTLQAGVYDP